MGGPAVWCWIRDSVTPPAEAAEELNRLTFHPGKTVKIRANSPHSRDGLQLLLNLPRQVPPVVLEEAAILLEQVKQEGEILTVVTGSIFGRLHLRLFRCPGYEVHCIEFEGRFISPRNFVQAGTKRNTRDWFLAICVGKYNLRWLINNKLIDFYEHEGNCLSTCFTKNEGKEAVRRNPPKARRLPPVPTLRPHPYLFPQPQHFGTPLQPVPYHLQPPMGTMMLPAMPCSVQNSALSAPPTPFLAPKWPDPRPIVNSPEEETCPKMPCLAAQSLPPEFFQNFVEPLMGMQRCPEKPPIHRYELAEEYSQTQLPVTDDDEPYEPASDETFGRWKDELDKEEEEKQEEEEEKQEEEETKEEEEQKEEQPYSEADFLADFHEFVDPLETREKFKSLWEEVEDKPQELDKMPNYGKSLYELDFEGNLDESPVPRKEEEEPHVGETDKLWDDWEEEGEEDWLKWAEDNGEWDQYHRMWN